jgi:hypothetical protein
MTFRMVGLCKSKSGAYTARKVIPEDVREEYQRLFGKRSKAGKIGKGHEVRFHAKPSTPHGVAKAQCPGIPTSSPSAALGQIVVNAAS